MTDMTEAELCSTTDALIWSKEFRKMAIKLGYSDMDEGWLLAWFSSAMMAMYDHAPNASGGWRPISEAPKDGTKIWMNINNGGVETSLVAYWCTIRELWSDDLNSPLKRYGQHWMPLPTPPTQAKEGQGDG